MAQKSQEFCNDKKHAKNKAKNFSIDFFQKNPLGNTTIFKTYCWFAIAVAAFCVFDDAAAVAMLKCYCITASRQRVSGGGGEKVRRIYL